MAAIFLILNVPICLAVIKQLRAYMHTTSCNVVYFVAPEENILITHESTRQIYTIPAVTWRNNNVIITPKRRCDVVLTL